MTTSENKSSPLEKASTDIEFDSDQDFLDEVLDLKPKLESPSLVKASKDFDIDSDQDFLDEVFGLKPKLSKPIFRRSSRKGMCQLPGDLSESDTENDKYERKIQKVNLNCSKKVFSLHDISEPKNIVRMKNDKVLEDFIRNY